MATGQKGSISRKLTRMNMLVSATALLLACIGFVAYDLSTFQATLVRNLSIQAQVAGSNSVSALTFDDPVAAERTLSAFRLAPNIVSACIYRPDGKAFATYQRDSSARIPSRPQIAPGDEESHWGEHDDLMLVHTIVFQGQSAGYVFIQSDEQTLIERMKHYFTIALAVLVLSLIVALFLSHVARRSIAEPVVQLAEVARTVSRGKNYAIRAIPGKEEGELAVLVATFNEMLEQIEEQDRSLRTAHDELERRVEQRTGELAAANKELESFSYSVSHDLRSPLRSIDGFSQALMDDYGEKLDTAANEHMKRIRSATQKMGLLIDDLLNLSKVTRSPMQREPVNLSDMARSTATELAKRDGQRSVEWVIEQNVQAHGDSRLLQIVLDNLLGNAWKYTSKHQSARIEFGLKRQNGSSAYFIKDDGAGFDPEYSARLFGAFQRLHGAAEFPGTGIGLATVQRIVLRHGGKVWAEGAVEKGATFYFTL
ncbi:MAG TPA: ATP-binding protein [Candidatus Acidoferrales bacterium]|nr:ATP-binding protein [Candidatus Acidoferrales bacterium]